jgi:aspartate aminotransferase
MRLAERMSRIGVESAFDVLVRAKALEAQGQSIVHLEIGEPDFPTPEHIAEAGKKAIDDGWTHYGSSQGLPVLREAIAAEISRTRNVAVDPASVCVTPGAKPILFFLMMALLEAGDEVIYPDPGFPIYRSMIDFLGAVPKPIPLLEERGFSFDLDVLRSSLTERTRLLILNSPHNPTGGAIPRVDIEAIAELVRNHDLVVLSDEIYSRIVYDDVPPFSIASLPGMLEKTVILDGFSKTFAMTGWRIGYGVLPAYLVDAVNKLMVNSNSCTAMFTQFAALAALQGPQESVERMVSEFRRRRDAFCAALNRVPGFQCSLPAGAFYAYPNISRTGVPSTRLADMLLTEAGVACLSGNSFGQYGDNYLRFSYANSLENLLEAARRIEALSSRWT